MKPIEILIPRNDITSQASPDSLQRMVFERCSAAGMPVTYTSFFHAIRTIEGTLETWADPDTDGLCVRWEPDQVATATRTLAQRLASLWGRLCGQTGSGETSRGRDYAATHLLRNRNR